MPSTINGIGTHYWGKGELVSRRGTCDFCGRRAEIRSYDTTLYFTALYIPLIPLGKKRILDECAVCTKHRAVPLKQWDEAKRKGLDAAADAATADRGNDEKAAKAVATAMGYQARDDFDLFAEEFGAALPNGPKTQSTIADGQVMFGRPDLAEAAYRKSLAASDAEPTREALAVLLMRDGRPEEARPLLAHAFDSQGNEKVGLLVLLTEAYQAKGMHREALGVLDHIAAADPSTADDKHLARLRKGSVKRLDTGKPMTPTSLPPISSKSGGGSNGTGKLAKLIVPLGLAAAAVVYLGVAAYMGRSRTAWLVSGLPVNSTVEVGGTTYDLPKFETRKIVLAEGLVKFRVKTFGAGDGGVGVAVETPVQTATVHTPFLTRPFSGTTFVLNPDGAAILVHSESTYVPDTQTPPTQPEPEVLAGEHLYAVKGLDYVFEKFPDTIKIEGTKHVTKHNLELYRPTDATRAIAVLLQTAGRPAAEKYLAARLALTPAPDDGRLPLLAAAILPPDQAIAAMRPGLEAKPVRVPYHRAYQTVMEREGKTAELQADYQKRHDADPADPALAYLLGRVIDGRAAARKLFLQAATAPQPVALGHFALAYDALSHADYADALESVQKAIRIKPDGDGFGGIEQEALGGLGRFRDALDRLRDQPSTDDFDTTEQEVYLLARSGDLAGARKTRDEYVAKIRRDSGPAQGEVVRRELEAILVYLKGDKASYQTLLAGASLPGEAVPEHLLFQSALTAGDPSRAKAETGDFAGDDGHLLCLLYLSAKHQNLPDADSYLAPALAAMNTEGREERAFAAMLASDQPPDPAAADALAVLPEQKRVFLAALGLKFPSVREKCYELARKYDYDFRFPHLVVSDVTGTR